LSIIYVRGFFLPSDWVTQTTVKGNKRRSNSPENLDTAIA